MSISDDVLSRCLSLPTILSYVQYDDLVRCMQVNRKINNCINRNWSEMNQKKIRLYITRQGNKESDKEEKYIISMKFGVLNNKGTDVFSYLDPGFQIYESSLSVRTKRAPYFILQAIKSNFVQIEGSEKQRMYNEKKWKHNGCAEMITFILNVLLPRVEISLAVIETSVYNNLFDYEHLAAIYNSLQEHYTPKTSTIVPILKDGKYRTILSDIVKALGARKFEFTHSKRDKIPWTEINTTDLAITLSDYDWKTDEIAELLEEWESGARDILYVRTRSILTDSFKRNDWDLLCSRLGVRDISGDGHIKLCTWRFELRRDIDFKRLDVTYYRYGDNLDIEELL